MNKQGVTNHWHLCDHQEGWELYNTEDKNISKVFKTWTEAEKSWEENWSRPITKKPR